MHSKRLTLAMTTAITTLMAGLVLPSAATAQEFYFFGSYGVTNQGDSNNAGTFTSDFTTGAVTGVTPPLTIPAGSPVSWNTEFDNGDLLTFGFGVDLGSYRFELEYRDTLSEVDSHQGASAGGIALSPIDAGVLISGNVGDLGVSVGDLLAVGRGQLETKTIMVNAFYDFELDSAFTPYVGLGIGSISNDIIYQPSFRRVMTGSDTGFGWHAIAGVGYDLTERFEVFANVRYLNVGDYKADASLFPASFELENSSTGLDLGIRFSF